MRKSILSMEGLEQAAGTGEVSPVNTAPQGGSPNAPGSTVPADASQVVEGESTVPTESADPVDEVDDSEERLAEADATASEMEQADTVIEDADSDSRALAGIAENMRASAATGGLDDANSRALRVATEHFYRSLSFRPADVKKKTYSQEDFKDKDSRIKATLEEANNIAQNVKTVLAKILAAIKKGFEMAAKYFGQLLDGAASLKKKADKLNGDASNLKGKALDAKARIAFGPHYALLSVNGKYLTGNALIGAYTTYLNMKLMNVDWFKAWDDMKPILEKGIKDVTDSDDQKLTMKQVTDKILDKVVEAMGNIEGSGTIDGAMLTTTSDLMFGTTNFVQRVDRTDLSSYNAKIESKEGKIVTPTELTPLSPDQVIKLTRMVSDHLNKYKDIPSAFGQFVNSVKSFFNEIEQNPHLQGEQLEILKKWMVYAKKVTYGNGCVMRRFDLRVCKALLDYAKASLDAVNAKPEEKKPA